MMKPMIATMLLAAGMLLFAACEPAGSNVANTAGNEAGGGAEEAKAEGITEAEVTKALNDLESAVKAGDAEALGNVYADDYVIVTQTGVMETKQQRVDSMKSGNVKYETLEFKDPKIRIYGNVAIVNMEASGKAEINGESAELNTLATLIFHKGQSGVQEVSAHLTNKANE